LRGAASGPLGAVSGSGRLTLNALNGRCRVDYRYEIHLHGAAAMIGGRMMNGAARQLINEFFRRFAVALGGPQDGADGTTGWRRRLGRLFGAQS
jgi:carbon monoxide dehydrogenase subunit G